MKKVSLKTIPVLLTTILSCYHAKGQTLCNCTRFLINNAVDDRTTALQVNGGLKITDGFLKAGHGVLIKENNGNYACNGFTTSFAFAQIYANITFLHQSIHVLFSV
ncbi:hypothetical protein [Chitinophaga flava]|uniref:Uncharacterized protein n=1 Tax=Chitinophaga flava TaxID=2259036 RepID=A0A365Y174_9BACT|nr:hypothetical protein [Chitinophaga flava]RBL91991.1 hypothetical protein DF182_05170 [Chitinophaga flava]